MSCYVLGRYGPAADQNARCRLPVFHFLELRDLGSFPRGRLTRGYHAEQIERIGNELTMLNAATPEQIAKLIKMERDEAEAYNQDCRDKHTIKMNRYAEMRKHVEAWLPPTPDHEGMKEFMLEQIDSSTKYESLYQRELPVTSPAVWVEELRTKLMKDFKYHKEKHAEEVERTNGRNAWVNALRASVPQPVTSTKG